MKIVNPWLLLAKKHLVFFTNQTSPDQKYRYLIGGRRNKTIKTIATRVMVHQGSSLNPKQGQPTTATANGNARGKPRGSIGIRTQQAD